MTADPFEPQTDAVGAFLTELRAQRERLAALARAAAETDAAELGRAVDEIGEQLLVADEELRVQSEHLEASTRRLDALVSAYEELFADAPTAYVQTDAEGLVVRFNRAAARLLGLRPGNQRSRTLPGLLRPADRAPVRQVLSRLRAGDGRSGAGTPDPLEAAVVRPDGTEVRVVLTARRSSDVETGRPAFHWELQEGAARPVGAPPARPALHRDTRAAVERLADIALELARQVDPSEALGLVAVRARTAVPASDDVGVTIVRSGRRIDGSRGTSELASACERLQQELLEGPCFGAIDGRQAIHVADLAADRRWPRFGGRVARAGIGSMIAVPMTAQRGVIGALNFYAFTAGAFDEDDVAVARAFGTHAAIALTHAELETNLRMGLETREEIGRAVGILMARQRITAAAAFDVLVAASQRTHRKLRDIAASVTETGELPPDVRHLTGG